MGIIMMIFFDDKNSMSSHLYDKKLCDYKYLHNRVHVLQNIQN